MATWLTWDRKPAQVAERGEGGGEGGGEFGAGEGWGWWGGGETESEGEISSLRRMRERLEGQRRGGEGE